MVRAPDWEASCCTRRHVHSTGEIGAIRLGKIRFDDSKKELEVEFHLLR
jgi:Ser-tRNA(Ala) deacylase AlaX